MRSSIIAPLLALALVGLTACGGGKSNSTNGSAANGSSGGNSAAMMAGKVPNCGAVKAVWVNLNTKVYHEPGDQYYGRTSHGEYLCPSQAKAQGFRPSGGGMMMNQSTQMNSNRHHRANSGAMPDATP